MAIKKVLKFTRGTDFSVDVIIRDTKDMVFVNMVHPKDATDSIKETFLYDAEVAVMTYIQKEEKEA